MSRSFTVKPAAARTQGRGRGTSNVTPAPVNIGRGREVNRNVGIPNQSPGRGTQTQESRDVSPQRVGLQQRMSHQGAYTVISPNEERRRQIDQQAKLETENYQRHKEQKKLGHVNYTGTVGGGEITEADARRNASSQFRNTKMDSLQKRQQYRSDMKKQEEKNNLTKKMEQRRKAELNKDMEKNRQEKLESDHRLKNDAFLKRIEAENRTKRVEKLTRNNPSSSETKRGSLERDEKVSGAECAPLSTPQTDSSTMDSRVRGLQTMFPECDPDTLRELLEQNDGSVDAVIDLLS